MVEIVPVVPVVVVAVVVVAVGVAVAVAAAVAAAVAVAVAAKALTYSDNCFCVGLVDSVVVVAELVVAAVAAMAVHRYWSTETECCEQSTYQSVLACVWPEQCISRSMASLYYYY